MQTKRARMLALAALLVLILALVAGLSAVAARAHLTIGGGLRDCVVDQPGCQTGLAPTTRPSGTTPGTPVTPTGGAPTQTAPKTPISIPSPSAAANGDGVVAMRDDATCASIARQQGDAREAIAANATANATNEWAKGVRPQWDGQDTAQYYMGRVSGNFVGTTDQILAWAACKWGFPLDVVRAQASQESDWRQSLGGDCGATTQPQTHGCASVGILQVKGADIPPTHRGTWPYAYESTSWNADYAFAVRRACYDGKIDWLGNGYRAGDLWGCVGQWFSGGWHDSGADNYIKLVQARLAARTWQAYYH
jgi:hypothetical protein